MAYVVMSYIVMAAKLPDVAVCLPSTHARTPEKHDDIVVAHIVMAYYRYGLCTYGLHSYGT